MMFIILLIIFFAGCIYIDKTKKDYDKFSFSELIVFMIAVIIIIIGLLAGGFK